MNKIKKQKGYIALMATIVISLVLLVMAVESGSSGWHARFNILGTEAKEQASSLAEGCAEQALASLLTDPSYTGDVTVTSTGGTCHIFPIQLNFPVTGLVTVKTQAVVQDSYANLNMAMNMNDIHFNAIPAAPLTGTLFITTHVVNDNSGTKQASDFTISVSANPSNSSAGSQSGTLVTVQPGAFSVSGNAMANYAMSVGSNCSGNVAAGEVRFCTITYDDITTTLTLIANVVNNNSGTKQPGDFPLFIDGTQVTLGERVAVTSGVHTASATLLTNYASSPWGYDCAGSGSVTVNLGQNKTCIINFDDLPPPAPICAETVMMLDRTGSMSSTDLADERTAATSLINLYSTVSPLPKIGVGIFGDRSDDNGLAPARIVGQLTTAYSSLTSVINTWLSNSSGYTNLADAIAKSSEELNSVRHVAGKEKVLVLISDGDPNRPTGSTAFDTGFKSPTSNAQNGAGELWSNPTGAYADGGTDASDPVSENDRHQFYTFGFGNGAGLASGSTVTGIVAQVGAWATVAGGGGPSTIFTDNFGTGGSSTDVPGWDEDGSSSGTQAQAPGSGDNSASPDGSRFAIIEGDGGWVCRQVNATNLSSLVLRYYWRGDGDAESSDDGVVEYRSSGSCTSSSGWSTLTSHNLNTTSWSSLQSVNLPSSLNNDSSFFIRFRADSSNTNESLRIDGVSMTGAPLSALACQVGVDLSWNSGTSWIGEKTQTISGTETTYTLGSASDDWTSSRTWQPTDFSNTNFRVRVRAIDPGSGCDNSAINHLDWLQLRVHYSQSSNPVQAALNAADSAKLADVNIFTIHYGADPSGYNGRELLANLASGQGAVSGHENGSVSDLGGVVTGNTGLVSPTLQSSDTGGDGNGFEVNPTNALADGPSGTSGAAQNINGPGDRHRYYGYNFTIPPNATITGIATRLDWWLESTSNTNSMDVQLSWNGGTSWSSTRTSTDESTSSGNSDTVGGSSDNWGHTWTASELSSTNFRVRLTSQSTSSSRDFFLDWVPVTIYYTVNQENSDGDNFFIAPTSADMQGIFNFIGEQVCPALLNIAAVPPPTTGTLMVITQVTNNNGGTKVASDFTVNVNASDPSQSSFAGSETGVSVTVDPGNYSITQNNVSGYTGSPGATCTSAGSSGPITAGEIRVCVINNDDLPPPPPPPNLNFDPNSWHEIPTAN